MAEQDPVALEHIRQIPGVRGVVSALYDIPIGESWSRDAVEELARISLSNGTGDLPGWAAAYDGPALGELLEAYTEIDDEQLWENLAYFLERIVPAAADAGVRMGIHPDDPPWKIFGLPRIIVDGAALERVVALVDNPANGVTFCTGSLGANPSNDLVDIARRLGEADRISFVHARNVKVTGPHKFHEAPHPRE